jgi:hypothetical protein
MFGVRVRWLVPAACSCTLRAALAEEPRPSREEIIQQVAKDFRIPASQVEKEPYKQILDQDIVACNTSHSNGRNFTKWDKPDHPTQNIKGLIMFDNSFGGAPAGPREDRGGAAVITYKKSK